MLVSNSRVRKNIAKVVNYTHDSESDCQHESTSPSDDSDHSIIKDTMNTPTYVSQENSGEDSAMTHIAAKQETPQDNVNNFITGYFKTFHESKEHSVSRICKILVFNIFV